MAMGRCLLETGARALRCGSTPAVSHLCPLRSVCFAASSTLRWGPLRSVQRHCTSAFTALEQQMWSSGAQAYAKGFGPLTAQASSTLLRCAELLTAEGTAASSVRDVRVLDVATGPGYVAEMAAAMSKEVVALDFVEEMVKIAAARCVHLPNVRAVQGDAQALPFESGTFDAITCAFGVLHFATPQAFFNEAARVLKPGGRLGFSVWDTPQPNSCFTVVTTAIRECGDASVPLPGGDGILPFFHFANREEVAAALCAAGFDPSSVRTEQLPLAFQLSDKHELFEAFLRGTGRTRAVLEAQSTAQLGAIRDHMADALERDFKTTRGTYEVPAIAVVHSAATATL
uniref:Methyltransferase type 11 domain-containing protein n=1 Tax=Chrysotila carterae TaxID=13221 RepID=A0A7S4AZE8_CHRCT|mmetsp:Transcript_24745/g.51791  ORF Transcript_24745/g.51791 Transcript_24745/m.51791 type:complete len:343 (+) Transcript_24745:10-1038(+)